MAKSKNCIIVPDAGVAPGLSNLIIGNIVANNDIEEITTDNVDEIIKTIDKIYARNTTNIELALENYKGDKGFYPHSPSDWKSAGNYPSVNWGGGSFPPNNLYKVLVEEQLDQKKAAYLPDVKESEHNGGQLLADGGLGEQVQWNYNSYSPKNNKNTYDLWVEYGDYGDDGEKGTGDDVVKVIGNWGE